MLNRSALMSFVPMVAVSAALALPGLAGAQVVRPGAIAGMVVDSAGKPVGGAEVVLRHGDRVIAHERSNAEGKFFFRRLRAGLYVVGAAKREIGRDQERTEVKLGEISRVLETLKK